ncbi:MAG: SMI1/KNR4 family protein [Pseudomonadota bacterium]
MEIKINPKWQLNPPATLDLDAEGRLPLLRGLDPIRLPEDYAAFLRKSEGAALRDKDAHFLAHFKDGVRILEIEWLGNIKNLRVGTSNYLLDNQTDRLIPDGYAKIGFAEPGPYDVVICVREGEEDYGKVYVWLQAFDAWMTGDNSLGLGWVADSFTAFMNGLAAREAL